MIETHPQNRRLGYARVSTYGQTLDAQLEQLRGAGCTKIFREKVTGAHSDRRQLLKMLHTLAPGDVVTVTRIDRLARSTFDLFAIVKRIVDAKGAIPFPRGAVGRHRHQHRALDAGGTRRSCRCGARSYPHPHGRGPEPRQGPRKAHGPTPFPHTGTEERGHQAARAGAQRSTNSPAATM
jgi:Resolvase, N terminal domain